LFIYISSGFFKFAFDVGGEKEEIPFLIRKGRDRTEMGDNNDNDWTK